MFDRRGREKINFHQINAHGGDQNYVSKSILVSKKMMSCRGSKTSKDRVERESEKHSVGGGERYVV